MQKSSWVMVRYYQNKFLKSPVELLKQNHTYIDLVMSLTPWGMTLWRDNILRLLSYIDSPQNTLKVFHVTGSNGKGSVCQMLSQALSKQFHKKVGLFTSPHLIDITERFQINGVPISHTQLNTYYERTLKLAKKYTIELSFFEIQVVAMVLYFTDEKVDYAVIETGLWGLYDGTNIFDYPLACFITSVTIEHSHVLWKTRKSILRNKLGIVKKWTRLYTHLSNKTVQDFCKKIEASCMPIKAECKLPITNLPGHHQQKNALLVLQALRDIWFKKEKILAGLKNIYNAGRFEWLSPHILVDTANNKQNIKILAKMLTQMVPKKKMTIIFWSTQIEPAYAAELANLLPANKKILVDGFCERALPYSKYSYLIAHDTSWHLDREDGIAQVKKILQEKKDDEIFVLSGSIYLVWYIMNLSRYNIFANE